jgi:hypothetical protein
MKALGILLIIVGFLFSLSGIGALIGIPLIIGGIVSFFYPIFAAVVLVGMVFGYEAGAQTSGGYVFAILVASVIILPLKHFVFDKLENEDPLKSLIFGKTDTPKENSENNPQLASATSENNDFWEIALNEVNDENSRIPSIWARAFAESLGDEKKSAAIYIKLRVEGLNSQNNTQAINSQQSAEVFLAESHYKFIKLEGFDCFVFPNGQCAVKEGDVYVLFNNLENLNNSIRNYGYTGMHDSKGRLRVLNISNT